MTLVPTDLVDGQGSFFLSNLSDITCSAGSPAKGVLPAERSRNMSKMDVPYKIYLEEQEIPTSWYNVRSDMKNKPAPLIHPGTLQPLKFEDMQPIFCDELIRQELDNETQFIPIPDEVMNFYKMYRPSPLVHAVFLEKALDTPAHIFYKFEGNNTSGSHKLNSAIAQAYYAKKQGLKGVTTETGAGQWGTALSMACSYFGLNAHLRCECHAVSVYGYRDRQEDQRGAPRHYRLAWLRDL